MKLIATLAEYLNTTLVPVINEQDFWGAVWSNWSGTGMMGNVVQDHADIAAGIDFVIWKLC